MQIKKEVSLEEYKNNLEAINKKSSDINVEMILLTFPPIINTWHSAGKHKRYSSMGGLDEFVELYRDATREFAKEKK